MLNALIENWQLFILLLFAYSVLLGRVERPLLWLGLGGSVLVSIMTLLNLKGYITTPPELMETAWVPIGTFLACLVLDLVLQASSWMMRRRMKQ